jgi:hypothetical protein
MRKAGLANFLTRFDECELQGENLASPDAKEPETPVATHEQSPPDSKSDGHAEIDPHRFYVEMEARLERERTVFLEQMKSERARWLGEESDRVASKFHEVVEAIFAKFEGRMAETLTRLAGERLSHDMTGRLLRLLREALADVSDPALEMRGPDDFLLSISGKLEQKGIAVSKVVAAQPDIVAIFGQTTLQTRMEEVLQELKRIEIHER